MGGLYSEAAWSIDERGTARAVVSDCIIAATRHAVQVFKADADTCIFAWAVEEVTLLAAPSSSNVFVRAAGPNQWFPVGPIAVERPRDVKKEIWNAEEPLRTAAFKMYPALAKPPAFGRVEYGYRERDESKKITEEEIRANKGKMNPFDDVILLTAVDGDDTEKQDEGLFAKFKRALNPYDN